jgi:tetratricopeptide (TPR) repeat protein
MKRTILLVIFFTPFFLYSQSNYDLAWKALNENNWKDAFNLLQKAKQDPANFNDAYITSIYLETYKGKENEIRDFSKSYYPVVENPYPYIYALWFNKSVVGENGKKQFEYQLDLIKQLIKDQKAPGTIVSSANYQMGLHQLFSNELDKAFSYFNSIGNLRNWQYTGPFENLSQTGHYKNYGPLEHPEPDAIFRSITGAEVKWFAPVQEIKEGWIPVIHQFNNETAVVYAQNFVNSPVDQSLYLATGFSGSIKVWVNDELLISEAKERLTEMDAYVAKCNLKKGVNRVLIQLGFTSNSFPNFIVRFTDEEMRVKTDITGSSAFASYPKLNGDQSNSNQVVHFAEKFFLDKIQKAPNNLVNYLLLADVYLRSKKIIEARNTIAEAITKAPNNCLLKMKMAQVLIKEDNRTLLLEEIEKIKQLDPESLLVLDLKIKELFDDQKYEDGSKELEKRIKLYGENVTTAGYKILLLVNDKKYDELVKEVEKLYAKMPENSKLINLMYKIKKDVYQDKKAAMKVYENYMKDNYDYDIYQEFVDILIEQGNDDKALEMKQKIANQFSYSPNEFYKLSQYYFGTKKYDKAEENIIKSLALAPYNEVYWGMLGDIKNEKNQSKEALDAYNKSLLYEPNQYTIINKIRRLDGKPESFKLLPQVDIDALVKADKITEAKNTDYGFYYILDQKDVIMHPGGATEEYVTTIIRITNEKGVDRFKESSIPYGSRQSLLIEKSEIIKSSQAKIEGEVNDNEIVFTNLEKGDVVVFKYRIRNFVYGRLAREYWDHYYFTSQIYTVVTRYTVLLPASQKLYYKFNNSSLQPLIKDVENFKQYTWEMVKAEPDKDEPLMPVLADVSSILHISTIPDWEVISDWYADISNNNAEKDFEILALYKELFPSTTKNLTQFQKARIIYNYIESNIRYSSVSFRQSAYVPQRPSTTLTTRLGDCKDLSSLFVTLAGMAGINAQMVLVDTRENGQQQILLPSVEFNHCIVKAELDKKHYYIELTDNYLPFSSLPNNLNGALIVEIPNKYSIATPGLKQLQLENKTKDMIKRIMDIKPDENDLEITMRTVKYGNLSSFVRSDYGKLDEEKRAKDMEESVATDYKNNVKLKFVKFGDLENLADSVEYSYGFKVKNEISEIGSLKTFRVVYPDVIASLNNFSADTRVYPIEFWSYENVDTYETIVTITAPVGTKFTEVPSTETLQFKELKYSIQYTLKSPDKLSIVRRFTNTRQQQIPVADYPVFKSFFEKIIKAENKFIAYK